MSHLVKIISNELNTQTRALARKEAALNSMPDGYLALQGTSPNQRLYWEEPKGTPQERSYDHHRLSERDYEFAKSIRDKYIFRQQCKAYRNNIKLMHDFLNRYQSCDEETIQSQMKEVYQSLGGLQPPVFEHRPFVSENPGYRENLIHRNSIGELYRSKSEVHISELLLSNHIPYRYEQKLIINGETKYPDFTIMVPGSKQRKFIEYFGRTDDPGYGETLPERINWYLNRGFLQGRDVLFLFENSRSGIDLILVWKQIESFLKI